MRIFSLLLLMFLAGATFAEAPVYEADTMPPAFAPIEQASDTASAAASSDDSANAFVPMSNNDEDRSGLLVERPAGETRRTLEQRINQIEQQQMHNNNQARIESLQLQVQTLTGQVEQLTHQLMEARVQQKLINADFEARIGQALALKNKIISPTTITTAVHADENMDDSGNSHKRSKTRNKEANSHETSLPNKNNENQPNEAEEQAIYQIAYNHIKSKQYNEAIITLQNMLKKYPRGQFAANAHYWLGELYGLLGKNTQAAEEFKNVVKNYPDNARVAEAQYKIGLIYAAEQKWTEAKASFKRVLAHYPGTATARLATIQLKRVTAAGH